MEKEGEKKEKAKGEKKFVRAYEGESWRTRIYETSDGRKYVKEGGSRSWRNNNPGNIIKSKFANRHGAIGDDGRFAIFPDYETGRTALSNLLLTTRYQTNTIYGAIADYAPPFENDTDNYRRFIQRKIGLDLNTRLSNLNSHQLSSVINAIQQIEGYRVGNTFYITN